MACFVLNFVLINRSRSNEFVTFLLRPFDDVAAVSSNVVEVVTIVMHCRYFFTGCGLSLYAIVVGKGKPVTGN